MRALAVLCLTTFLGCDGAPTSTPPAAASPITSPTDTSSPSHPVDALDALDGRTPLPLLAMMAHHQKENMRDHLMAVQEIVAAIANDDFSAAEKAAQRIGYSEQMGHMCTHMGAGAPGFTEQALAFHHTADGIAEAARARDASEVMRALGNTLKLCTGCHASYKQQVVDQTTWERLTASPPPHGGHSDAPH